MSDNKGQVLIVSACESLPGHLTRAVDELQLNSHVCRPHEAMVAAAANQSDAIIVVLEQLNDLAGEQACELLEQLDKLSAGVLVLGRQAAGVCGGSVGKNDGLFGCAGAEESADMLKGRLATLLELAPVMRQQANELGRLRMINKPLNSSFLEVDQEMRLAARLQQDFLPRRLPEIEGMEFATVFRPASWVSGDIYDVSRLDEEHIGIYIADAVGHGMPAALLTMFIKRALVTKEINGHHYELVDPGEALIRLNDDMVDQDLSNHQFATCCYGILNVRSLELRIASAGHPPPMCIHKSGQTEELRVRGSLLGIFAAQEFQTETVQLAQGDKFLLYSDGVEVAFVNEGPDKPLRFRQEFGNLADCDIKTMCNRLVEIIDREEGSLHPRDDVTIVGIEIGGG